MEFVYKWSIPILWGFFWGYWGIAGLQASKARRAESKTSRLIHLGLVFFAFLLVGFDGLGIGLLAWNILPQSELVYISGITITALGLLFAVWARVQLGRYWSGIITIKTDHHLIRTGPYAWVRHPIYTGILAGMIGTSIAVAEIRGLLAVVLIFIAYFRKIQIEETWLVKQFGAEYIQYQHDIKAIIPFLL